ncbi:cadherin-like beta sandwich domain-containing protein [Clostridium sp. BL-8]|uniref:cadherin-like beta sandwich domain-containing protein n=1 Tax=Clostridium sp. BL-8 TaxID=349938 RepID=UPI0009C4591A|nr:cadherin-like beta sandwich domain-containing protein [Clostridium sp. BL-8]OOM71287.1 putative endo-beta-N-acetylglucosaminidase precursor [Clostridium sp. BL-8]
MNKNLKKIIAITAAIGMISAVEPVSSINFFTLKAYASDNTVNNLSSLELETSGGSTINLYSDSSYNNEVGSSNVSDGGQYYAKSSSRTVKINISGPDSKYVKVFKSTSSSTEGKSIGNSISLSSGTTTLVVRVYDNTPSSNIKYSSDNHVVSEYKIRVKYSHSSSDNDDDELDSLKLETTNGDNIRLYEDDDYDSDEKVDNEDVDPDTDYYAKTSSNTVNVHIGGISSKYVRVFKSNDDDISDSAKGRKVSSDLSLSSGRNTIVVRVYDDEPDDDVEYGDDDGENDYTIHVKCTCDGTSDSDSSDDNDNADDYDDIYLDSLSVEGNNISLSDSKVTYTYSVASDVDEVTIKARPEDEDEDTVEIDGDEVDDDDNYKKDVDLNNGENDITIKVEDDDDNEREYTLKIYRGGNYTGSSNYSNSTSTNVNTVDSTPNTATIISTVKTGWVQVNGRWQYNDNLGKTLTNQWFFDRNYNKWYYLGSDGFMMENCWIISGGKYYYLTSDGSMAANTIINGYRVGADGAWIR